MLFKIIKASRYFKVYPYSDEARVMCLRFQHKYVHRVFSLDGNAPTKIYASALHDNSEFRFHRNTLPHFMVHITESRFRDTDYALEEKPLPVVEQRNIKVKKEWTVRDYQEPIIEYLQAPLPVNKFIGIQTGLGKTFCSLYGVAKLGFRTIVIVEGGLVTKWAADILKVLDIKSKRTLCVRGGKQLRGLIAMAGTKEYKDIDVILLSSSTLQDWITLHEVMVTKDPKTRDIGYGIEPDEFYEKLQIGHRLIDEVHKKFHFNYKQDLFTNTHLVTSLSATLFSYDKNLESFYDVAYPTQERYKAGEIDKYANSIAVLYNLRRGRKVKTMERGRSTYSHTAFETSICNNRELMLNYFEMISETIDIGFIANFKKGNKAAVYVASIDMATKLTEYLRKRFPDKSVERYVGSLNDPYANLLDPDIRVTTLGSAGTGHDIEGLTDTILTVAIMSLQANIQVFGRLRFIPDQDTRFYYFNCRDVEQHMKYHGLKAKLMQERAATFDIIQYYTPI